MHKMAFVLVLLASLFFVEIHSGQAQVMPFNAQTAMSTGFEERAVRTFFRVVSKSGLRMGRESMEDPLDRSVIVLANPVAIPFAVTNHLIQILVVPIMRKQLTMLQNGMEQETSNTGLSDITLNLKYALWQRDAMNETTRLAVFAGVKFPTGSTDKTDASGNLLPISLQLGTGSWDVPLGAAFVRSKGHFGLTINAFYHLKTEHEAVDFGDQFNYDLAIGYRLYPAEYETYRERVVILYMEVNGLVRGKNDVQDKTDPDSGGHTIFLSPGLQWIFMRNLLVEASIQLPVFEDFNGTQLEDDFIISAGIRYLLPL